MFGVLPIFTSGLVLSLLAIVFVWSCWARKSSPPEKAAVSAFLREFPGERIAWTRIKADEPERFVIGLFYGMTRPPRYKFYSVEKRSLIATVIVDDTGYAPKVWR